MAGTAGGVALLIVVEGGGRSFTLRTRANDPSASAGSDSSREVVMLSRKVERSKLAGGSCKITCL